MRPNTFGGVSHSQRCGGNEYCLDFWQIFRRFIHRKAKGKRAILTTCSDWETSRNIFRFVVVRFIAGTKR